MIVRMILCLGAIWFLKEGPAQCESLMQGPVSHAYTSVLSAGKWYKIKITKDGIYKLTYEDIKGMGFSDPSTVRIYGNGGSMLSYMNADPRRDDLVENPVYFNSGDDGVFSAGDYILFYGHGPVNWKYNPFTSMFEHSLNLYSDAAYYFVTADGDNGKIIARQSAVQETPTKSTTSFLDRDFHERNKYNFLKSGRQWFGERIESPFDTVFHFANLESSSPVIVKANTVSRSANKKSFIFESGDAFVGAISLNGVSLSNSTGTYANQGSGIFTFSVTGDQADMKVSYNKTESSDEGYLDYITMNARRKLIMTGDVMFFRDPQMAGMGSIAQYSLSNCTASTQIWDITDLAEVKMMAGALNGSTLTFADHADSLKEYVAVNTGGSFPSPVITSGYNDVGPVANQNLHAFESADLLIVTHPDFKAAADSIALFHQNRDHMTVAVATTDQVYNEFSSGAVDVSAIRDLAKMIYDRGTDPKHRLHYLLLLGDGSYNNISRSSGNSNYIPTYQSESSLNAATSYVSDDFFGFMDNTEGGANNMEAYSLDLGVGRLPAKKPEESMTMFRKIKNYDVPGTRKDWRNNIMFVGDDEEGNSFMMQASNLGDYVRTKYPQFVVKKVMLDAYKQVATSTGARYPEVNRIITNGIEKGILIYNYTGHGGERGMAAEQILQKEDIQQLNNLSNLPLFFTATCEFSRFDDLTDNEGKLIESTSAGESSLLSETGGSIALFSTTRIVYADRNDYLNNKFYHLAFTRDEEGRHYKLGDMIRMTKDSCGVQSNKLNFILLGDPALGLAIPEYIVKTDSLNGTPVTVETDTLKAFSKVRISGHLEDVNGSLLNTFNGNIYPSVFDKSIEVNTLANDLGDPFQFQQQERLLFKGKASIVNGRFSFEFIIPKDITYSFGKGKVVYYSEDRTDDANGYFDNFIIGGTSDNISSDEKGPDLSLYLNDRYFKENSITNPNPVIYAEIADTSGINMVGNGIGHDITGVIDGDVSQPVVLNDYFESELNDYTRGTLSYPMFNLSIGMHSLTVKVWDIYNNSSEKTIEFQVIQGIEPVITNAFNYPNPASDMTMFSFEHNKAGENLNINISVFDLQGRLVASLDRSVYSTGFTIEPMEWDLRDSGGNMLRQGVYPYRIMITDEAGRSTQAFMKLVVVKQ